MFFFYTTEGMILFFVLVLPALLFVLYAQSKVKSTYNKFSKVKSRRGYRGAEVARELLNKAGLSDVSVEQTGGQLSDHYDPIKKAVRLSSDIYSGSSIAALGIAAHETGHALQHAHGYFPLNIRNMVFPAANLGSRAGVPLFIVGFIFNTGFLMDIGIAIFFFAVLFQIITLPVEFNASSRAVAVLESGGYLEREELGGAKKVLRAAAMTYVAATAMALAHLIRLLILRGRD